MIELEWDEQENSSNQRKHGLPFEEAAHVFPDPLSLRQQDRYENGEEPRQALSAAK